MQKPSLFSRASRVAATSTLLLSLLILLLVLRFVTLSPPRLSRFARPPLDALLTLGIKTYVCDDATEALLIALLASVRRRYPTLPVLVANDGPRPVRHLPHLSRDAHAHEVRLPHDVGISAGRNALVARTNTPFFLLLDDDHYVGPAADFARAVQALREDALDIVGLRVVNEDGIKEMRELGVRIPRYVANVTSWQRRTLELCVWNENNGPDVSGMRRAVRVDVVHNALVARTQVLRSVRWREELKVNEHMTFFLDAKRASVKVGYLPSVQVWHRARRASKCYTKVREREESFASRLDYRDEFEWHRRCSKTFPEFVRGELEREAEDRRAGNRKEDEDGVFEVDKRKKR